MTNMTTQDGIEGARRFLEHFAWLKEVVDALDRIGSLDTAIVERTRAHEEIKVKHEQAVGELNGTKSEADRVQAQLVKDRERCDAECSEMVRSAKEAADALKKDAETEAARIRSDAASDADGVRRAADAVRSAANADVAALVARAKDLRGLVESLSASKKTLEDEIKIIRERVRSI